MDSISSETHTTDKLPSLICACCCMFLLTRWYCAELRFLKCSSQIHKPNVCTQVSTSRTGLVPFRNPSDYKKTVYTNFIPLYIFECNRREFHVIILHIFLILIGIKLCLNVVCIRQLSVRRYILKVLMNMLTITNRSITGQLDAL